MKRLFKILLASVLAVSAITATACNKVKSGSVVKNCTVTIRYDGDKTQDVTFELYLNYAPATIEHFTYLVEKGYYNGTVVSNLSGYIEFGEYKKADGALVSKADDYGGIITAEYMKDKKVVNGENRYLDGGKIYGEFYDNGIGGNKLDLSSGSLVLKRDYSESISKSYYNTGKATMAITFSTGSYFNDKNKFAILGKLVKDDEIKIKDADGNEKTVSSYDFVYSLMNDYKTEKDADETYSNTYYKFNYDYVYPYSEGDKEYDKDEKEKYETLSALLEEYGRYFMKDKSGDYYYKNASGAYETALDDEDEDDKLLIDAFGEKSVYLSVIPYKDIVIEKIVIEK